MLPHASAWNDFVIASLSSNGKTDGVTVVYQSTGKKAKIVIHGDSWAMHLRPYFAPQCY
jgi:hypothetical protein